MLLTERQAKALRQTLRTEMRMAGTGFPMSRDLFRQLERKGLVTSGEHTYERRAWNKVIASRIPIAFLTSKGRALAEVELIKVIHQELADRRSKSCEKSRST